MEDPLAALLGEPSAAPINLLSLAINVGIGGVLAALLAWHFVRYGRSFGNRTVLAQVFVIMTLVTIFIVTLAKSSFALSLGMLGAASLVRFRTPIKEPEELAYLFFAIGIGIGLGANAWLPTLFAFLVILGILSIRGARTRRTDSENLYLTVEVPVVADQGMTMGLIKEALDRHVRLSDLRRLDIRDGTLHVTFRLDCQDKSAIIRIAEDISHKCQGSSVTFVEQRSAVGA